MFWESRKSIIDSQVFETINRMARPVGVVLFGVECELKHETRLMCWRKIRRLMDGSSRESLMNLERAYRAIRARKNVLVVMPEEASVWERYREDVVKALERLGANQVVGIFVKKSLILKESELNKPETIETNHLIKAFDMKPPEAREFNQLFIVKDTWE